MYVLDAYNYALRKVDLTTNTVSTVYGGQDFYTIPQAKTLTIGLNARF